MLLEKSGDSNARVKEDADNLILQLADAQMVGTISVINHIIKVI